ncbi:MAG: hypothetical protein KJ709_03735 [Nanoarchaeota archaeon]|nr:hypothetical protein [Nanoarchaeota archaeon]
MIDNMLATYKDNYRGIPPDVILKTRESGPEIDEPIEAGLECHVEDTTQEYMIFTVTPKDVGVSEIYLDQLMGESMLGTREIDNDPIPKMLKWMEGLYEVPGEFFTLMRLDPAGLRKKKH